MSAGVRGQNYGRRRRVRGAAARSRVVKTRRSTPHAGGRPLLFIPAAVVERAATIARSGLDFSTVVRELEREGNGAWPRRTLLRRVASTSSSSTPARGQNQRREDLDVGELEQIERVDKTKADRLEEALLGQLEREGLEYDSPGYHDVLATLHGLIGDGRCGCYSCNRARSSPTRRRRRAQ